MKSTLPFLSAFAALLALARHLSSLELQTERSHTLPQKAIELSQAIAPLNSTTGTLRGTAIYDGEPPEPKSIAVPEHDQESCHCKFVLDESLIVDKTTRGLKWTIVRIMGVNAPKFFNPTPAHRYQLSEKSCTYTPHVVVVPPGHDLEILNPEKVFHNLHVTPFDSDNPSPGIASGLGMEKWIYKGKWLQEPDLIQLKCDIHNWMSGFILCHDPRFCAVSAADGTFEIKNLPPGIYKLNVWHEKFGNYMKQETIDVEIKAGAVTDLGAMKFAPKK